MLTVPAGWKQHIGVHLSTFYPPGGGGRVRCHERLRPLIGCKEVVARILGSDPHFRVTRIGPSLQVVTHEGEHGAWVALAGMKGLAREWRFVGMVFADEYVVALDTLVTVAGRLAELEIKSRELLQSLTLGLGVRRRRFFYVPPPGWQPLPNGLQTTWYPLGFPRDRAKIVIPPATLEVVGPSARMEALHAGDARVLERAIEEQEVRTTSGLTATVLSSVSRREHEAYPERLHRDLVVLTAAPYQYVLRLEVLARAEDSARVSAHRETFARVLSSVQPVPVAGARVLRGEHAGAASSGHWVE